MIRLLAGENFDANIVRGVRRRLPALDIVRVQDIGLRTADDPTILSRSAKERRVTLTLSKRPVAIRRYPRVSSECEKS